MDKKTFTIAMAVEIPIAFIIFTLLFNGKDDVVFYIAWAAFAIVVTSVLLFLSKIKDEAKKEKIRKNIARAFLSFIIIGALVIAAFLIVFIIAFSTQL